MNWEAIGNKCWEILTNGGWLILKLLGIFILGYIIIRIIKKGFKKILNKSHMDELAKKFFYNTLSFILYFLLVLILLQSAGISISGILAALAAAGLAVALALQDALSSLANGIILVITKPFKKDDAIVINGISGKVKQINFFSTVIDTWDNRRIIIPNKNMINYEIENTNYNSKRRFTINLKVSHDTDFNTLKALILKVIVSNENVFTDPFPNVQLQEINESNIKIQAKAWANSDDCDSVALQINETLFNELKKNKINFATNSLIIHTEQRNENPVFDNTELPERDLTIQPKTKKIKEQTFDEYIDNLTIKKIRLPKKSKKNQKP